MGNVFPNLLKGWCCKHEVRLLMVGLDAVGKTTILYKLKLGEVFQTLPTIGFNVETIEHRNINFIVWDVVIHGKMRYLWMHYLKNAQGLIYVIDSGDRERIGEAKEALVHMFIGDELQNALILILANKQDLPNALTTAEITEEMNLNSLSLQCRSWRIQATSATSGDGLYEGLEWFSKQL